MKKILRSLAVSTASLLVPLVAAHAHGLHVPTEDPDAHGLIHGLQAGGVVLLALLIGRAMWRSARVKKTVSALIARLK